MDKETATLGWHGAGLESGPADRWFELLSSFSALQNNHQHLVKQLRGSLNQLRELRQSLRYQYAEQAPARHHGTEEQRRLGHQFGLTRREAEVAHLLSQGRSNEAIARELNISQHTARHHTQRILSKLEVHSRGEAGAKIRGWRPGSPAEPHR